MAMSNPEKILRETGGWDKTFELIESDGDVKIWELVDENLSPHPNPNHPFQENIIRTKGFFTEKTEINSADFLTSDIPEIIYSGIHKGERFAFIWKF